MTCICFSVKTVTFHLTASVRGILKRFSVFFTGVISLIPKNFTCYILSDRSLNLSLICLNFAVKILKNIYLDDKLWQIAYEWILKTVQWMKKWVLEVKRLLCNLNRLWNSTLIGVGVGGGGGLVRRFEGVLWVSYKFHTI